MLSSPQDARAGDGESTSGTPYDDSVTPKDLKVKLSQQRLLIEWKDGKHSEYLLGELRRRCPCATCRTDRERQSANALHVLTSDPTDVRVTSAELVGNYAIKMRWSDGHDTGIFDFRFLRSLDGD